MRAWEFSGTPFEIDASKKWAGFVYCITNEVDGRRYIGRKYLTSKRKGKRAVESDWRGYCGSSEELLADIAALGAENFKREIISLHRTRGAVNYAEMEIQYQLDCVHIPSFYNRSIGGKFNRLNTKEFEVSSQWEAFQGKWALRNAIPLSA